MAAKVVCHGCNKRIKAGDDWLGKVAKCPNCGTHVKFPDLVQQSPIVDAGNSPEQFQQWQPIAEPAVTRTVPPVKASGLRTGVAIGCLSCFVLVGGCFVIAVMNTSAPQRTHVALDPAQQEKRKELIDKLTASGIFYKVVTVGNTPHVWVTPLFMALNFDDKQNFISVVCAYYDSDMVTIKNSRTGERIGSFSREYGGLSISE